MSAVKCCRMSFEEKMRLADMRSKKHVRLLLSSFGFNTPVMREKLDSALFIKSQRWHKRVLILPYAGFDVAKTFEREKAGLVEFGFTPDMIVFAQDKKDFLLPPDYIYVPGGDPFKLLKSLRELDLISDVISCVTRRNAVYIGVSAGADIAAANIEYVTLLEDNNHIDDGDFSALGLIPEIPLCHYDHRSFLTLEKCGEISGRRVITINDDQLVRHYDGDIKYVE